MAFSSGGADVRFLHHKLMCSVVPWPACGYLLSVKSPTGSQDRAKLEMEVPSIFEFDQNFDGKKQKGNLQNHMHQKADCVGKIPRGDSHVNVVERIEQRFSVVSIARKG